MLFGPSIIFDTITLANYNNGIDIFLVKYGNTGDVVWAKRFGGNSGEFPNGISLDAYGNIYLVGTFSSDSINFGALPCIILFQLLLKFSQQSLIPQGPYFGQKTVLDLQLRPQLLLHLILMAIVT
ncbi:MAG: SBBP repeat-containing protein [Bacteroidetes bacterium]|nr:SBBP repeat-containing protein [Bacteroidota bacterium]